MSALLFAAALLAAPVQAPAAITAPAAQSTAPSPRQTVDAIAARIRDIYFDPAAADRIATDLQAAATAGDFDGLTDGRDLAPALTARLRRTDAHFSVIYDPAPATGGPGAAPASAALPRPSGDPAALAHYGFRRAEILPGNIGYIDLRQFYDIDFQNRNDPARRAADAALAFVADTDAVIIDLRDNGGGAPSMVGYLTSAFTPANAPIYNVFHSRGGTRNEAPAIFHPTPRLNVPLYILISARSASAAEAFPYTLQAAGRATIVGETSAGAANPGGTVPVGGGFGVFISGGSPRNPITRTNWEGTGVRPDVAAPWSQALEQAHILALEGIVAADPGRRDATWALEALRATAVANDLNAYVGAYGELRVTLEAGKLLVTRGRRPPAILAPLGDDLFTTVGEPGRRVRFVRDDSGRVFAMEALGVGGPPSRNRRTD